MKAKNSSKRKAMMSLFALIMIVLGGYFLYTGVTDIEMHTALRILLVLFGFSFIASSLVSTFKILKSL